MKLLIALLIFSSSAWAASGQVGAYVIAASPSPSPSPSPELRENPAPVTGFAVAVNNDSFIKWISEILKSLLRPFGLS